MINLLKIFQTIELYGKYKGYPVVVLCLGINENTKYTMDTIIQQIKQQLTLTPYKKILIIKGDYTHLNSTQTRVLCIELHKQIPHLTITLQTEKHTENKTDVEYILVVPSTFSYTHLKELFQQTPQYTTVDYLFHIKENQSLIINLLNRLYKENHIPPREILLHPLNEYEQKQLIKNWNNIQFPFKIEETTWKKKYTEY